MEALVLPVLFILVFWLFLIRPQRRRAQEMAALQRSLEVGQRVMTTSGMVATVVAVDDETVTLESAGVPSVWIRAAVGRVMEPAGGATAAGEVADPSIDLRKDQSDKRPDA